LSPKIKIALRRIAIFIILWLTLGLVYVIIERGILGDSETYPATGNPYDFKGALISIVPGAILMGSLFGVLEVLVINTLFRHKPFLVKLIIKSLIYLGILILFLITMTIFSNAYQLNLSILDTEVMEKLGVFVNNLAFWSVIIFAGIGTMGAVFISEITNYLGPNVLVNFLSGKYHKPRVESRIFMFLDMKSSTSIAERLGHEEYFSFLNDYFADLTEPIVAYDGEIYQFVGDEIVATWKTDSVNNCDIAIAAFFDAKSLFRTRENFYQKKYGIIPDFKAGIHGGKVSTGQIGTVKKEIVFSGDVLNTAARIQALCNTYDADLLVSHWIMEQSDKSNQIVIKEIGKLELKGKSEEIMIYQLSK